jgi:ribonuclease P protein component
MEKQKLTKEMRLHGKVVVNGLFTSGESFFVYPFKVVYVKEVSCEKVPIRLLVSVSRRNFKNATDRNTIKRRTKECWRKNLSFLQLTLKKKFIGLDVGLVYTGKKIETSLVIEDKIKRIIERLIENNDVDK